MPTRIATYRNQRGGGYLLSIISWKKLSLSLSLSHTHTHTRTTHTHTRTHTHMHSHLPESETRLVFALYNLVEDTHSLSLSLTHIRTHTRKNTHTHIHAHTHTQPLTGVRGEAGICSRLCCGRCSGSRQTHTLHAAGDVRVCVCVCVCVCVGVFE